MAPYGYDLGYFDQTGALFQIVRNTDDGQKLILDPGGVVGADSGPGHRRGDGSRRRGCDTFTHGDFHVVRPFGHLLKPCVRSQTNKFIHS